MNNYLKNPNLFLFFAIVSSAIVLFFVGAHTYNIMENVLENSVHAQKIRSRVDNIHFLDEVLTSSTLLAVGTGDAQWEKRYHLHETKLNSAINELLRMDSLHAIHQRLQMTDSANVRLNAIEHHVFDLVHLEKRDEASAIMMGSEYARLKAIYSEGLSSFINLHEQETNQLHTRLSNAANHSKWSFVLVILFLAIVWLPIERFFRRSRAQMLLKNQELELQIQARKESESALYESNKQIEKAREQLQESIKASSIGLWEWNLQTNEVYHSPEFKKQIGYGNDEAQSSTDYYFSHLHPDDAIIINKSTQRLLAGEVDKLDLEYRFCQQDGQCSWMMAHTSLQRDQDGKPIRMFGSQIEITERKNAEQLIKGLNERFNLIAQATNDCVYDWDMLTNQIWWNPALSRLFGYSPEIITTDYLWWEEKIHPDDFDSLMQDAQKVFDEKLENFSGEYRFKRADGSYAYVFDRGIVLYDKDKNPIRWVGSGIDITERKKAEEKLKESEENYRILAESSPAMIYLIDRKGYVNYVNKIAAAQFRTPVQELEGKHLKDIFPPDLAQQNLAGIQHVIATKNSSQNEVEMLFPTGNRWIDSRLTPVFDEKGDVTRVLGLSYDITERKQMEMELRKSEKRLRDISKTDFVWEVDEKGVYTYTSQAGIDLFGSSSVDIIGKTPFDFMTPDERERLAGLFAEFVANKAPIKDLENWNIKKNGEMCCLLTNALPILDQEGKLKGFRGVDRDITERKKAEAEIKKTNEELRKLNAEKDKFFSIIAHDLKSPFNSIIGFSEILLEQVVEKNYQGMEEYTGIILQSSQRAMDLLMNLMEWSRSQTGRMEFNPEYFEMAELIDEVELLLNNAAGQKSIVITNTLPDNIAVYADKNMMSAVLRNLISNAIKFTHPGGEIIISAEGKGGLTVSVSDNGIGIPKDRIEQLFRIHENYSTSGTQNERGTGLGLILCKEFIEKHGGKIWVESEEGKGSIFYFTIP